MVEVLTISSLNFLQKEPANLKDVIFTFVSWKCLYFFLNFWWCIFHVTCEFYIKYV